MRLLTLLGMLPLLAFSCTVGYNLIFDGECVKPLDSYTFDDAKRHCSDSNDYLLMLKTAQDAHDFRGGYTWLGLTCDGKDFIWDDGTPATYTNFQTPDEVCNSTNKNRHYWVDTEGIWFSANTGLTRNTVCQAPVRSWICDDYDLLSLGKSEDICFYFTTNLGDLQSAQAFCELQKANIAPIHDNTFNDYLKRTAIANGLIGGIHIGLQFIDGHYIWDDGSAADFLNFAPGYPDFSLGECFAMGTGFYPGQWINVECSKLLPFACSKQPHAYDNVIVPTGCPINKYYYPGDELSSPNWGSATGPASCQYYIIDMNRAKKVSVEITFFESNMCCDMLRICDGVGYETLLSINGYYGFVSINVTASANTLRMEWNATSGAHVRGWHARVFST